MGSTSVHFLQGKGTLVLTGLHRVSASAGSLTVSIQFGGLGPTNSVMKVSGFVGSFIYSSSPYRGHCQGPSSHVGVRSIVFVGFK